MILTTSLLPEKFECRETEYPPVKTDGLYIFYRGHKWLIIQLTQIGISAQMRILYNGDNPYMKGQIARLVIQSKKAEEINKLYNSHDQRTRTRLQKKIEAATI